MSHLRPPVWALLTLCSWGLISGTNPPPTFEVNLALPPRQRYRGAVQKVLENHGAEFSFLPVFAHWNNTFWHKFDESVFQTTEWALQRHYPENAEELQGIVMDLHEHGIDVSFGYLSAWVYRHELQHTLPSDGASRECTGIVVQGADGVVRHGRNEDLDPRSARNLTLSLRFVRREGSQQMEIFGTDWYWFTTGLRTAMLPKVASLSGNYRFAPPRPLGDVLADIDRGTIPDMLVFLYALAEATRDWTHVPEQTIRVYDVVLEYLSTKPLATPSYYVIAGAKAGQGAVISRWPNSRRVVHLGGEGIVGQPPAWALVQTNYDLWEADPEEDPRRKVATNVLQTYRQGLGSTALGLFAVLSSYPVHNEDTAYTTIMSAATGEFTDFVRTPMAPAPTDKKCWEACCRPEPLATGAQCTDEASSAGAALAETGFPRHFDRMDSELTI